LPRADELTVYLGGRGSIHVITIMLEHDGEHAAVRGAMRGPLEASFKNE
jgi:hypothetical protein